MSLEILKRLEGDEQHKLAQIKNNLHLHSERNARAILHILENSPDKFEQKVTKEIGKLEDKLGKEYARLQRKLASYLPESTGNIYDKINELKVEIEELHKIM